VGVALDVGFDDGSSDFCRVGAGLDVGVDDRSRDCEWVGNVLALGINDGMFDSSTDGIDDGLSDGAIVGAALKVGAEDGPADFSRYGAAEGWLECSTVGTTLILGTADRRLVGANEGSKDSSKEGTVDAEGATLGTIEFEGGLKPFFVVLVVGVIIVSTASITCSFCELRGLHCVRRAREDHRGIQ